VYYSNGATSLSIILPTDTAAFLFYAEPDPFQVFTIEATAQDGTVISQNVDGFAGAAGYGFYGTVGIRFRRFACSRTWASRWVSSTARRCPSRPR